MKHILVLLLLIAALFVGIKLGNNPTTQASLANVTWQKLSSPGELSAGHQFLENNCEGCHVPAEGVDDKQCILCHANNESVLIRQPTAFHADVQECSTCHTEHQGVNGPPTTMDHSLLFDLAKNESLFSGQISKNDFALTHLKKLVAIQGSKNNLLTENEALLQCSSCHENDDKHFKLFGKNCGDCHATLSWTLANYVHPSSNSTDCSQCHQAPPSHYKPHYKKMSQKIAGKPNVPVDQCFQCHQSTSWNDIQQLGLYKHH